MAATRRATMPQVAELAGVSIKTVSRVVNDEPNVSPETMERVLSAIETLSFRRNDLARNLRAGLSSATIGLVIEDLSNPFYGALARAAEEVARGYGTMLMAASSEEDPVREKELVTALLQRRVDGLLIVPASDDHRYLNAELAMGTPIVFLDRPPGRIKTDQVLFDNRGGARLGVGKLIAEGHRRIGVIGPEPGVYTIEQRLLTFRETMAAAKITVDDELIVLEAHDPEGAAKVAEAMLSLPDPPTGFFTLNNRMTVGAVRTVWQAGSTAAIVGFDDFELADMLPVPITVVGGSATDMGRRASELLFDRLNGRSTSKPRRLLVPTKLEVRGGSVGARTD